MHLTSFSIFTSFFLSHHLYITHINFLYLYLFPGAKFTLGVQKWFLFRPKKNDFCSIYVNWILHDQYSQSQLLSEIYQFDTHIPNLVALFFLSSTYNKTVFSFCVLCVCVCFGVSLRVCVTRVGKVGRPTPTPPATRQKQAGAGRPAKKSGPRDISPARTLG